MIQISVTNKWYGSVLQIIYTNKLPKKNDTNKWHKLMIQKNDRNKWYRKLTQINDESKRHK
jgi:hypothetical protein